MARRILGGIGLFLLGAVLALCGQVALSAVEDCQANAEICTD